MAATADHALRVLYAEPDANYGRIVAQSLNQPGHEQLEVVQVGRLQAALTLLLHSTFDAILLDPSLPDNERGRCYHEIRAAAQVTPIIVLTANDDTAEALSALDAGAQDYLVKGQTNGPAVMRAIRFAVERVRCGSISARESTRADSATKILLIEDNRGDAFLLEDSLTNGLGAQCDVTTVSRLTDALERLANDRFHLAVVDLSLPDSRGLETCLALRRQAPEVPFIVHSGSADEGLALKTVQHGASDYLVKSSSSVGALTRAARFALRRRPLGAQPADDVAPRAVVSCGDREHHAGVAAALDTRPRTWIEAAPPTAPEAQARQRRRHDRYPMVRSALAIPIAPGGWPDWQHHLVGITCDLSYAGIGLELDAERLTSQSLMVGVERRDGVLCYAGLDVTHTHRLSPTRLRVGGRLAGRGQEILDAACRASAFNATDMCLTRPFTSELFDAWCKLDVMKSVPTDRVQVCPRCRALPTFRLGCRSCGSGRIVSERMIHHFACALVRPIAEFEEAAGLVCPKCRARGLVVGVDFEYQSGIVRCQDCHWSGGEPEQVGQCLRCAFRFPGEQALSLELTGYHVCRLDPLAFIAAP